MEERQKTLAAVTIIIGFVVLVVIIIGAVFAGKKIVSPIPDSSAIRIIFVTPTPVRSAPLATPSAEIIPTATPKPKPKPTATPKPAADTPTPTAVTTITPTAGPTPNSTP